MMKKREPDYKTSPSKPIRSDRMLAEYCRPEMITYDEDEILAVLGPAQARYAKPDAGDGGGFL